jgi:hypothetical protein
MKKINFYVFLAAIFWASFAYAAFFPINKGMVNQVSVISANDTQATLVASSNQVMLFEGSTRDSVRFPDAQNLPVDWWYEIINNASGDIEGYDGSGALIATTNVGRVGRYILKNNGSTAGSWKFTQAAAPIDIPTNFDSLYYRKTEHVSSTAGVPDAGKPIVLNGSGLVDNSMLPSSAISGWGTAGNAGIDAANDFLGTVDANDLVLRTNNTERFRITSTGSYDTTFGAGVAYTDASGILGVSSLTASRAMVTDGSGVPVTATVTSVELSHVGGASSNLQAQLNALSGSISSLTGDVTASGPGAAAATVALVGGETAADVATSVNDTQAATAVNTNSTIVKRDGSGNFAATTITAALTGNASTSTALAANPTDCAANQFATTIAANGNLTCAAIASADLPAPSASTIAALDINWTTLLKTGGVYKKTLAANSTFTFSNLAAGCIQVWLTNTASNYTVTWPASVEWPDDTAPTQTVGAKTDVYSFCSDGTTAAGSYVQNYNF